MFATEGNKYGEVFTEHEMWRTLDTIVMDEVATFEILRELGQKPSAVKDLGRPAETTSAACAQICPWPCSGGAGGPGWCGRQFPALSGSRAGGGSRIVQGHKTSRSIAILGNLGIQEIHAEIGDFENPSIPQFLNSSISLVGGLKGVREKKGNCFWG